MPFIRSFARNAITLCFAWPLLFLQLQPPLEVSQKPDAAALPPLGIVEGETLLLPGVVIVDVPKGSAAERAGLQVGDVITYWAYDSSTQDPCGNLLESIKSWPSQREGAVVTFPDWVLLKLEYSPRWPVVLRVLRGGTSIASTPIAGGIHLRAEPNLSAEGRVTMARLQTFTDLADSSQRHSWESLRERLLRSRDWSSLYWISNTLGRHLTRQGKVAQSITLINATISDLPDPVLKIMSLWSLVAQLQAVRQHSPELRANEQAATLAETAFGRSLLTERTRTGVFSTKLAAGIAYENQEQLESSIEVRKALAPCSLDTAASLNNLAASLTQLGNLDRAATLETSSLTMLELLAPDSDELATALTNSATRLFSAGDIISAEQKARRAVEIHRTQESKMLPASLLNLGIIVDERGDMELAESLYSEAIEQQESRPGSIDIRFPALVNLAEVASRRGEFDLASELLKRALQAKPDLPANSLNRLGILQALGEVSRDAGYIDKSTAYLTEAGRIGERPGLEFNEFTLTSTAILAEIFIQLGAYEKAEIALQRCLSEAKKANGVTLVSSRCLCAFGSLRLAQKRTREAISFYQSCLSTREAFAPLSHLTTEARSLIAESYSKGGAVELAIEQWGKAVEELDAQSAFAGGHYLDSSRFRAHHRQPYERLVAALVSRGSSDEAFLQAEKAHARSLIQSLQERDLTWNLNADPILDARLKEWTRKYREAQLEQQSASEEPSDGSKRQAAMRDLETEFSQLKSRLRAVEPRFATLQFPETLGVEGARRALDPGTLMISYLVTESEIFLFSLPSGGELRVRVLPIGEKELRQRVQRFRELVPEALPGMALGDLKLTELRSLGKDLFKLLLAPEADRIEKAQRVMIVADGLLHYLPFAALTRTVVEEDGSSRDKYLAEWRPFYSVLSATVFAELRRDRRDPAGLDGDTTLQLVAFGDPRFPTRLTPKEPDKIADIRVRSVARGGGLQLAPLPYTRREVEGIATLFPPARVQTFLGGEATEERAKAIGKGARILHFATHARLDDRFPLNSALLLTMPEGFPEDRENGLLQVWEIFEQVRLDADLVVLSACDSGLGEEQGGEGLIGLTRAFQYAGARTVLASLWAVRDEATAELMIRFYRHLTAGESKDRALQAAERELLAGPIEIPGPDGKPSRFDATAPYYWAAFQVIGDWQ